MDLEGYRGGIWMD